jgi:tight adherence protein B
VIALGAAALLALGLAAMVAGILQRGRERERELALLLDLPFADAEVVAAEHDEHGTIFEPGVALAHAVLARFDAAGRVQAELIRARIPLRPGEFMLLALGASSLGGIVAGLLTGQLLVGVMALPLLAWTAWALVLARAAKRVKAFEQQLPEALSLIAASLEAGHTFLRAAEMMVEESAAPLSEEFERALTEVRLGDNVIDAMARMSDRLDIADLAWVVQAIRIQQTVGGKLAELLTTLADFMRAREEIRREVQVLTAEGRMSARVLGALPLVVFLVIKTLNPSYVAPLLHGTGLIALIGAGASVVTGILIIRKMAKIEV